VFLLEYLISFLIAVMAGVACHYKRKEESLNCTGIRLGDSFFCPHWNLISFCLPTLSYTNRLFNIHFLFSIFRRVTRRRALSGWPGRGGKAPGPRCSPSFSGGG
jgi:hypothetical protein